MNGVTIGSRSVSNVDTVLGSSHTIGLYSDTGFIKYFQGRIDDLRIYSRALSELDVLTPATRGEVVQTILEAYGVPIVAKNLATFSDVPSNHRYAAAITLAFVYGIIDGDTNAAGIATGTFRPDAAVNRSEVARMLALASKLLTKVTVR